MKNYEKNKRTKSNHTNCFSNNNNSITKNTIIYYGGTSTQWTNEVTKGSSAFGGRNVTMVYNSTGIPE